MSIESENQVATKMSSEPTLDNISESLKNDVNKRKNAPTPVQQMEKRPKKKVINLQNGNAIDNTNEKKTEKQVNENRADIIKSRKCLSDSLVQGISSQFEDVVSLFSSGPSEDKLQEGFSIEEISHHILFSNNFEDRICNEKYFKIRDYRSDFMNRNFVNRFGMPFDVCNNSLKKRGELFVIRGIGLCRVHGFLVFKEKIHYVLKWIKLPFFTYYEYGTNKKEYFTVDEVSTMDIIYSETLKEEKDMIDIYFGILMGYYNSELKKYTNVTSNHAWSLKKPSLSNIILIIDGISPTQREHIYLDIVPISQHSEYFYRMCMTHVSALSKSKDRMIFEHFSTTEKRSPNHIKALINYCYGIDVISKMINNYEDVIWLWRESDIFEMRKIKEILTGAFINHISMETVSNIHKHIHNDKRLTFLLNIIDKWIYKNVLCSCDMQQVYDKYSALFSGGCTINFMTIRKRFEEIPHSINTPPEDSEIWFINCYNFYMKRVELEYTLSK